MSGKDRRPYESATVLDQQFLDFCQDNLDQKLQLIVEIEKPQLSEPRVVVTLTASSPGVVNAVDHAFINNQAMIFETTGTLPPELTAGTTYYVDQATANTFRVSATAGGPNINFSNSGTGTISASSKFSLIRVSDRNIVVGSRFYSAKTKFPVITRTIGEWLTANIEFSVLEQAINNVDGAFNSILPGGEFYGGMINKSLTVKLGLRDVESTYFNIFKGFTSPVAGAKRDIDKVKFVARDQFDDLNFNFPTEVFKITDYPKISNSLTGRIIPVVYGDYTTEVDTEGNMAAVVVNSKDPQIDIEKEFPVVLTAGTPGNVTLEDHRLDDDDEFEFITDGSLPPELSTGTNYYAFVVNENTIQVRAVPAGPSLALSGVGSGTHSIKMTTRVNVKCVISENDNLEFDENEVWLNRSQVFYRMSGSDIVNVNAGKNYFEVTQDTGNTLIDGANYLYSSGDQFQIKVKGKDLGAYSDNAVWQARDLLLTYSSSVSSDFGSNWTVFRDKNTPAQSAISDIKSRIWVNESQSVLTYVLSLLEQVRLEMFIDRDLNLQLNAMHFEEFSSAPSHTVRNFDVEQGSPRITVDERNNFNRAAGFFDFKPVIEENHRQTLTLRNQDAIDQISGKQISKRIEFPNLYIESDVTNQVTEILKLASAYIEYVNITVSSRAVLLDIADFIKMNVSIGSTVWDEAPMMVRAIGYDPEMKLVLKLMSMQMVPYTGYSPGFSGIVGGSTATITSE